VNRTTFLKTSGILGVASLLPSNSVFAHNVTENGIDKLVDAEGNFALQALP
jgi:Fe-Mn family superoxide dismutase